jgi:quinol monooxygenase YgiN
VRKYIHGGTEASATKERINVMSTIVLINPFEVPQGQEEAFLKGWHAAAEHLRQAPGFLSTRLHESLDPQARFRFVNVAEWESPQHFQAAMGTEAFEQISRKIPFTASPALYRVIAEEQKPPSL